METKSGNGLEHINVKVEKSGSGIEEITNTSSKSKYYLPLFTKTLTGKDWFRFINSVKSIIRSSYEYKLWVGQCKEVLQLRNCSFLGNVEDEDTDIEIHHAYLTIHDVIEIIADHMLREKDKITSMTLAHEVMKAHYAGLVAIIPVSTTIHELIHAGKIRIHYQQVYGDLRKFLTEYKHGVKEEHLKKIHADILAAVDNKPLHEEGLLEVSPVLQAPALNSGLNYEELTSFINNKLALEEQ